MRKLPILSGAFAVAALVVAACGGTAAPTVPPVTIPSIAIPSIAIPSLPLGSFVLPSFAIPSFAGDPDLVAKFPKTIGGQPVGEVRSALYIELFTAGGLGGSEQAQQFAAAMTAIGVNPATVSYGSASVELSETTEITAIRTPGFSASQFLAALPQLQSMLSPDEPAPTVGQTSIAGKTITTTTDANEKVTYLYPSGDTIWTTDATDPADLTAIFTAIQ